MLWQYAKRTLATLAVLVLVGFSLAAVVTKLRHGQLLSVQSGSMVPHFKKGDLVSVNRVAASSLNEGDIITFINPANKRQTITHRIIETPNRDHPGQFVTKGDANPVADKPIPVTSVVGKTGWSVPYLGYAVDFVRQPIGLILIIYIPAMFIVWGELTRLAKHYEKQRPYLAEGYAGAGKVTYGGDGGNKPWMKFLPLFMLAVFIGAISPVQALLFAQAEMRGNTIAATNPASQQKVVISEVFMRCSQRNSSNDANRVPLIMLYNPSNDRVKLKNWTLRDNSGNAIMTFPARTMFKHQIYIVSLYLPDGGLNGLQYAGDSIGLYTDTGQYVDGLSWGTDVSEFDPSIQGVSAGTTLRRKPIKQDTNTAADWQLRDIRCAGEPRHSPSEPADDDVQTGSASVSNTTTVTIQITNGSGERTLTCPEPLRVGDHRIAVTSDQ